jgi:hypothetical protein
LFQHETAEELERRIAEREKTRMLPRWARRVLFWSGVALGASLVGVAIFQSQEKKRVPVRMAWQFVLRDADVQKLLGVPPNDDGLDEQGNRLMLVPPFWRSWIIPTGYEVATPEFNHCAAVSYSAVPVYAPTGATGYIISEAVRYGGPADWRVDYVEFVLTRPPSRPLYDADGSVSKQRASPPTIFTFHAAEEERVSLVLFDRRLPTQLGYTFVPGFLDDVHAAERRIALRNIFVEPSQASALQRAIAASDAGATVENAAAIGNGVTQTNEHGARVSVTSDGQRVGDKFMTFRNTMQWWVDYRAHRWSMIAHSINYPAVPLVVESPKYDDRIGS